MKNQKEFKRVLMPEQVAELAKRAILLSGGHAKWFAVDASGAVCAYLTRPVLRESVWACDGYDQDAWDIADIDPPANFREEIYQISIQASKNQHHQ